MPNTLKAGDVDELSTLLRSSRTPLKTIYDFLSAKEITGKRMLIALHPDHYRTASSGLATKVGALIDGVDAFKDYLNLKAEKITVEQFQEAHGDKYRQDLVALGLLEPVVGAPIDGSSDTASFDETAGFADFTHRSRTRGLFEKGDHLFAYILKTPLSDAFFRDLLSATQPTTFPFFSSGAVGGGGSRKQSLKELRKLLKNFLEYIGSTATSKQEQAYLKLIPELFYLAEDYCVLKEVASLIQTTIQGDSDINQSREFYQFTTALLQLIIEAEDAQNCLDNIETIQASVPTAAP